MLDESRCKAVLLMGEGGGNPRRDMRPLGKLLVRIFEGGRVELDSRVERVLRRCLSSKEEVRPSVEEVCWAVTQCFEEDR